MEQSNDGAWVRRLTKSIGQRIAYYRSEAKDDQGRPLSAQALARRCDELGLHLDRPAISKLENGLRQTVSVAELLVLARALGVSPAELLLPIGYAEEIDMPGGLTTPWAAYKWVIGRSPDPLDRSSDEWAWKGLDSPAQLWEEHGRAVFSLRQRWLLKNQPGGEVELDAARNALRRLREAFRTKGMTPPPLGPDTAAMLGDGGGDG